MRHVSQQHDAPGLVLQGARLDGSLVVDDRVHQIAGGLGGHDDRAAISLDQALVLGQRVEGALINLDLDQTIARKIEIHLVARRQRDVATTGCDGPAVGHLWRNEGHHTAGTSAGLDDALVDNTAGKAVARKLVAAGQEVFIAQVQRRCHQ